MADLGQPRLHPFAAQRFQQHVRRRIVADRDHHGRQGGQRDRRALWPCLQDAAGKALGVEHHHIGPAALARRHLIGQLGQNIELEGRTRAQQRVALIIGNGHRPLIGQLGYGEASLAAQRFEIRLHSLHAVILGPEAGDEQAHNLVVAFLAHRHADVANRVGERQIELTLIGRGHAIRAGGAGLALLRRDLRAQNAELCGRHLRQKAWREIIVRIACAIDDGGQLLRALLERRARLDVLRPCRQRGTGCQ